MGININETNLEKARATADEYAKSKGKSSIDEVLEPIKENLNSSDATKQQLGAMEGRKVVEELTMLLLRQELFTTPDADYMSFVETFKDGEVQEGNGKLYDFNNAFGSDTYQATEFIPDEYTKTSVDEYTIQMYSGKDTLSAQGYQFRKSLIFNKSKWIPFFKQGNLTTFIAQLEAQLYKVWRYYIFDKIMNKITGTAPAKVVNSTADNAFDGWIDFLKVVRQMETLDKQFNYKSAQANLMLSKPSDLLIFAHPDNIQTLQSGIKSQLYNAQFLDFKSILDGSNFINAGKKLKNVGDATQQIDVDDDYYIPKNTVYVIHKDALRHFTQLDEIATQFYARNLAIEVEMHKWGALDILPWGQMFKFTCAALDTTP